MEYSRLPSLLHTKLTFKSFQLQEKAERLEAFRYFWVKTSCLKVEVLVFCWLNISKCHRCSSGTMRSLSLAPTMGHTLSAFCKKWWQLITGQGGMCILIGVGMSVYIPSALGAAQKLSKHQWVPNTDTRTTYSRKVWRSIRLGLWYDIYCRAHQLLFQEMFS